MENVIQGDLCGMIVATMATRVGYVLRIFLFLEAINSDY